MDDLSKESSSTKDSQISLFRRRGKEVAFMGGVTGICMCLGFGWTISTTKKQDPNMFYKGLRGSRGIPETGGSLALRALGWATVYSVSGVGILCFAVWKLMGTKTVEELRSKMKSTFPEIPKNPEPGRSDFKTVREFVNYCMEDGDRKKGKGS